jgi:competence protein ComGF
MSLISLNLRSLKTKVALFALLNHPFLAEAAESEDPGIFLRSMAQPLLQSEENDESVQRAIAPSKKLSTFLESMEWEEKDLQGNYQGHQPYINHEALQRLLSVETGCSFP